MMLVTGVCNTLLTKYQDMQCVRNCHSPDPEKRVFFEQPVIQTVQMFIGETGCWLVVAGFALYRRFVAAPAPLFTYHPVADEEADEDEEVDEPRPRRSSQQLATPVLKPVTPNDDERCELRGWKIALLALPACCDIAGTTLMNVGLLFVAASIYQMTRGALVLFVGIFSVIFLRRHLHLYKWLALLVVVTGVAIVGLAGAIFHEKKVVPTNPEETFLLLQQTTRQVVAAAVAPTAVKIVIGVLLIAGAQIFTATQFVLEEWILESYALQPLKVVSWEGTFGLLVTIIGMVILHFTVGVTPSGRYGYFDASEGLHEITHIRSIAISSIFIMISIGGFNYFGLSVTRSVSATSRSTIDTCRTLFIWIVSLGLGWETFKWLQVLGFALLVYGTFLFNDIVRPPFKACLPNRRGDTPEELLPEEPIEHL
ncbi:MAG: hypothetical protein M1834_009620 [Cirrosporium novae-zelandiae]|nr:MAG: hypothetical protein M1834_009620 [Cirrosporium novae-zelandiae]